MLGKNINPGEMGASSFAKRDALVGVLQADRELFQFNGVSIIETAKTISG